MAADPSDQVLKTLWQAQEEETDPMTLEQIHAMVDKFDRRTRRAIMAFPLAIAFSTLLIGVSWARACSGPTCRPRWARSTAPMTGAARPPSRSMARR